MQNLLCVIVLPLIRNKALVRDQYGMWVKFRIVSTLCHQSDKIKDDEMGCSRGTYGEKRNG